MKDNDIVIAGCGLAGALAALTVIKKGLDALIVEKKAKESIGKKICGELMPQSVICFLKNEFNLLIDSYPVKGLNIVSASGREITIPEPLCMIDRLQCGQALVAALLDRGAHVLHDTVTAPIYNGGVKGIKTRYSSFLSKIAIDCTGIASALIRKIHHTKDVIGVAYKENITVKEPVDGYASLHFDKRTTPSGYTWSFPKGEHELNVGAGGLPGYPYKQILKTVEKRYTIVKRECCGYGIIPLGRPLPSLVYGGLLVCGDAGQQVNPVTGEGIAPALKAGYYAGRAAAEAVECNDVSTEKMWMYNYEFFREFGSMHTALTAVRDFLLALSDKELAFLLESIQGTDMVQMMEGKVPGKGIGEMISLVWGCKNPGLLFRLHSTLRRMRRIRELYECYPQTPEEFTSWQRKTERYF